MNGPHDRTVWIRARGHSTGMFWAESHLGAARSKEPPEGVQRLAAMLDPQKPSVVVGAADDKLMVACTGYPTSQQRVNTPDTTAVIAVVDADTERAARLASRILAGLGDAGETNVGAALVGCVLDGPDTLTFSISDQLEELLDAPAPPGLPDASMPTGYHQRSPDLLRRVAGAVMANHGPPADGALVVVTSDERAVAADIDAALVIGDAPATPATGAGSVTERPAVEGARHGDATNRPTVGEAEGDPPLPAVPNEARLLPGRSRSARFASTAVNGLAIVGAIATIFAAVAAFSFTLDIADRLRRAVGSSPPETGRDWYLLAVAALMTLVAVAAGIGLARLARRRHRQRIEAVMGPSAKRLAHGPRAGLDRPHLVSELLTQPSWQDRAATWRAAGRLPAGPLTDAPSSYEAATGLIMADLADRVGKRALATGLAVAVTKSKTGDAIAVVSGLLEIQLDTLASLGVEPTQRTYLHLARTASLGIAAASYLDIEDRLELELALRAAVLGIDSLGDLAEAAGDVIDEDLADALSEVLSGGGGGLIDPVLGLASGAFGLTGSVLRQVADMTDALGAQLTEGLVIASMLHYHGLNLAAEVLARDEDHRRAIQPTAGAVPRQLFDISVEIARRQRRELRDMLRKRTGNATRSAPRAIMKRFRDRRAEK